MLKKIRARYFRITTLHAEFYYRGLMLPYFYQDKVYLTIFVAGIKQLLHAAHFPRGYFLRLSSAEVRPLNSKVNAGLLTLLPHTSISTSSGLKSAASGLSSVTMRKPRLNARN